MPKRPLEGIKVADFSWFGAGPIAGNTLSQFGAEVVRVESESKVDGIRAVHPFAMNPDGTFKTGSGRFLFPERLDDDPVLPPVDYPLHLLAVATERATNSQILEARQELMENPQALLLGIAGVECRKLDRYRRPGKDVARLAGVGLGTASRVVSGKGSVSPATLAKVRKAIEELDFRPSHAARSLLSGTTKMIGVYIPVLKGTFYTPILQAIDMELRAAGLHMVVAFGVGGQGDARRQAIEGIAIIMLVYLTISLALSALMNWYNRHIALRGQNP